MNSSSYGVNVTISAGVFDTETKEVLFEKATYLYHIRPELWAYEYDVVLMHTVNHMAKMRFLLRFINQYSQTSEALQELLKKQNWDIDVDIISVDHVVGD